MIDVAWRMDVRVPECDHAYNLTCVRDPFHRGIYQSVKMLRGIIRENNSFLPVSSTILGSIVSRLASASFKTCIMGEKNGSNE